ncbi:MAG: TetR/AcrR family transcriptional regulator [Clostridia bacterium]|nr:TetR/AcrR family transcriptional regulator [Clostridia bacterium]MBT7122131.1 TetR/AcrR family transcriptional regulator [Clostridia bacterium]
MHKLPIKQKRMLQYFIEATQHIIDRDGFDNVTIRKISEEAGYNSATIYNYYEDLEHLLQFACVEYLINYQNKLIEKIKGLNSPRDIYFATWTLFARECYNHPKVFYQLFFSKHKNKIYKTFYRYVELFDVRYENLPTQKIFSFITLPDLAARHIILLESLAQGGFIDGEHIEQKANMLLMILESMLNSVRFDKSEYSKDQFVDHIITYSKILLNLE